ncbi:hypothetical protein D3C72_844760 [compost metagenome]
MQDAWLGKAQVSLGRWSLNAQQTWSGWTCHWLDRGSGRSQGQGRGYLRTDALGFFLGEVADQCDLGIARGISLAMKVLHLGAGDGGQSGPGSVEGLGITVVGKQLAEIGFLGLSCMGLLFTVQKVLQLGFHRRQGLLR